MAGRQQRDRRGVQGQHVCVRPWGRGSRCPLVTGYKPVPMGWPSCCRGPGLPAQLCSSIAGPALPRCHWPFRPQFRCFCVPTNSFHCTLLGLVAQVSLGEQHVHLPRAAPVCSGQRTARRAQQNLWVSPTGAANTCWPVHYSGPVLSCSSMD